MGRKPNPLILEFFERGPKLEDASNRYQHTCKACGEKFPKGRIDSLTTHLFKKCKAISVRDRQRAVLQLHDIPDVDTTAEETKNTRRASLPERPREQATKAGQSVDVPVTEHDWTPLETLAEVSRQFDLSDKRTPTPQGLTRENHAIASEGHPLQHEDQTADIAVTGPHYGDWMLNDPKG